MCFIKYYEHEYAHICIMCEICLLDNKFENYLFKP